jgi:hypothetical protein
VRLTGWRFRSKQAMLMYASSHWAELAAFGVIGIVYISNVLQNAQPIGYAGLYSLMTETLDEQMIPMPDFVPYYGSGGLPFAYPPVGFYIAHLFTGILRIPMFTYLRWAPPLFTLVAIVCAYWFFKTLTQERYKALIAAFIISMAETIYVDHATAAGMVRALALVFAMCGATFSLLAYRSREHWLKWGLVAAVFLALTTMSHLSYMVFLVIGIFLMAFLADGWHLERYRIQALATILFGGFIFSSPWWLTVGLRYGFQIFHNASETHGTLGIFIRADGNVLGVLNELIVWYKTLGQSWWPSFFVNMTALAIAYSFLKRNLLLPFWLIAALLAMSESERFQIIMASILIAVLVVDIIRKSLVDEEKTSSISKMVVTAVFLILVVGPFMKQGLAGIRRTRSMLSEDFLAMTSWVRMNTYEGTHYLYLGDEHNVQEWLPYLSRRTPLVAHWGTEWTGEYLSQGALMREVKACVSQQSSQCVMNFLEKSGIKANLLITRREDKELQIDLSDLSKCVEVYENEEYVLFGITDQD